LVGERDAEALAQRIIDRDMKSAKWRRWCRPGYRSAKPARTGENADTLAFEKDLSDVLGLRVEIKRGSGESGLLVIKYGNYDQLDYIGCVWRTADGALSCCPGGSPTQLRHIA